MSKFLPPSPPLGASSGTMKCSVMNGWKCKYIFNASAASKAQLKQAGGRGKTPPPQHRQTEGVGGYMNEKGKITN